MDGNQQEDLNTTRADAALSIAKGIVGALPYGGALFAEIIGMTIPNQRLDRVIAVLRELDQRLSSVEKEQFKANKYALDLFEDGMIQAARSLTEARNRYIAVFIQKCAGVEESSYGMKKKLFYVLQELTDLDIEILLALEHGGYTGAASSARYPGSLTYGQYDRLSEQEKYEYDARRASWGMHISTLERFGLVEPERQKPDVDYTSGHIDPDTGLPKIMWYNVSNLGKVFLRSIGEKPRV